MNKNFDIIIASGLYPSDIGGPATYASHLCQELPKNACSVSVVTYGTKDQVAQCHLDSGCKVHVVNKQRHILLRYLGFFWTVWRLGGKSRIIYAFDLVSVGLPCALAKVLKPGTKFVVRLGGDYQWEKAVQYRDYDNTLEKYYEDKKFSLKEKLDYFVTNIVLALVDKVIFNSEFLLDIFVRLRGLAPESAVVIKNIIPDTDFEKEEKKADGKIRLLYAGRIIKVRNLKRFLDALSEVKKTSYGSEVLFDIFGEGPEKAEIIRYVHASAMDHMVQIKDGLARLELMKKITAYDIVVLPSLTDINPNFIAEAIILKKHIIITKYTEGYYAGARSIFLNYINPLDADDISQALKAVIARIKDDKVYDIDLSGTETVMKIGWPLEKVVGEHLEVFKNL
jgi:glycosyltransferase involved in cell wall biosynthesis